MTLTAVQHDGGDQEFAEQARRLKQLEASLKSQTDELEHYMRRAERMENELACNRVSTAAWHPQVPPPPLN